MSMSDLVSEIGSDCVRLLLQPADELVELCAGIPDPADWPVWRRHDGGFAFAKLWRHLDRPLAIVLLWQGIGLDPQERIPIRRWELEYWGVSFNDLLAAALPSLDSDDGWRGGRLVRAPDGDIVVADYDDTPPTSATPRHAQPQPLTRALRAWVAELLARLVDKIDCD